jgi:hypothetical protein
VHEGEKSLATDIQAIIDRIHSGALSEGDLLQLLTDARALVRANVLLELPKRKLVSVELVTSAVVQAAHAPDHADVRLMGTATQRVLAVATLAWLRTDNAKAAFERELNSLGDAERERARELVAEGPAS